MGISEYLFEDCKKKKLPLVNFIAILWDSLIDSSITEQQVLYVIYTDPETFKPTMTFFEVAAPSDSQDVSGLKQTIFATFRKLLLESVLKKIVFLLVDGASVNCGKDSGLISKFQGIFLEFVCFTFQLSTRADN